MRSTQCLLIQSLTLVGHDCPSCLGCVEEATEAEEDLLDKAWGLEPDSRLSCQAIVGDTDLMVEISKYTINVVKEAPH